MRVVIFSHYFPPEGNAPASRIHALARRWVAAGDEVHVITCAPNVPDGVVYEGYANKLIQTDTVDGIRVTRVWTYMAANRGVVRRAMNYISYMVTAALAGLFVKRPDLVVATSPQFFCGWAGVIVSKMRRLPFILEIRDLWPDSIVAVGALKGRCLLKMLEKIESLMYASADHIVTVGDGYKQRLIQKNVHPDKISIVMNGIDGELSQPQEPDQMLVHRWGLDGKFVCSYIGTVGMASGLDTVLRAAEKLSRRGHDHIRFLIVGDGAVRVELERQTRMMGLENVVFTGRQPREMVPMYLSISDACLVHLRKAELFATVIPSKIFEAAGAAKPIIIGVEGCARDLVLRAGAGIAMESDNEDELIAAVLHLADDPERRRRLGEAGYNYFTRRNDRDAQAVDYGSIMATVRRAREDSMLARV